MRAVIAAASLLALTLAGCGGDDASVADPSGSRSIDVTSPAFGEGKRIPSTYTCAGDGTSPALDWSGVPENAPSVALVVDDPDAPSGDYVHWIVLNIPTARTGGIDAGGLPDGAHEIDGSGGPGWSPPCPPSGTHHYRFTVYAFAADETFSIEGGAAPDELMTYLGEHAVAWGRLTGTVAAK